VIWSVQRLTRPISRLTVSTSSQGGAGYPSVVDAASQYLGVPYVWGGDNPNTGLDCSGFVQLVFRDIGIDLARTTYEQVKEGTAVSLKNLKPGDVIFTEPTAQGPGHEGLYLGNGIVQESPHTGTKNQKISLQSFLRDGFVAARRFTNLPQGKAVDTPVTASEHEARGDSRAQGGGPGLSTLPDFREAQASGPQQSGTQQGASGLLPADANTIWQQLASDQNASPETRQLAGNSSYINQNVPNALLPDGAV
jgi:NlpC/P60 family